MDKLCLWGEMGDNEVEFKQKCHIDINAVKVQNWKKKFKNEDLEPLGGPVG